MVTSGGIKIGSGNEAQKLERNEYEEEGVEGED